ncbi:MAG: hypothetical protein ACTH5B_05405 [Marinomonas sp.]|uniref:hypothetical protein n=1 Tax=Marinomonas sp. TaxID=1904862 RepID=UPI003F958555
MKRNTLENKDIELYTRVKAGFILQGSSLGRWCLNNGVSRQNAAQALKGIWNGPKSTALKELIVAASGIDGEENGEA